MEKYFYQIEIIYLTLMLVLFSKAKISHQLRQTKQIKNIMLLQSRDSVPYNKLLGDVIGRVKKQGYSDIRADIEDYEAPHQIIGKTNDVNFTPDVTATKDEGKAYFEIAQKIENTRDLVNKWKLLETLAHMKKGVFQIYVPHGQMKFTQELILEHNIKAILVKM